MPTDDDDLDFFRQNMNEEGVRRLHVNRANVQPTRTAATNAHARRAAAVAAPESADAPSRMSDGRVTPVRPSEALFFALPDLPWRTQQQLKRGAIEWQAGLDLHGYTLDEARSELETFLNEARRQRQRCVIVVHGKSRANTAGYPVIKSHVNAWLREMPFVLAFCSSLERDGGTGAVYVLLKKSGQPD
ncbi:Smr/MutS family protein [Larsenimonas salina]|uniref:Smr/MutS family protein n=1 Tax=Larsenimonas salina TaxID=1295565 RepID=UPI002072E722|nr:Smr/MutS family protein [Larsenimonas salina]MCM5703555.1 Smr/MutS family endonuclease [Larsenimonas salina]